VLLLLPLIVFSGCDFFWKKKTNWSVSLDKKDTKPYGGSLAFQSMNSFFPNAVVKSLSPNFRYNSIDQPMMSQEKPSMLVAVGLDFYLSQDELKQLFLFIRKGNEVVLFTRGMDKKLKSILHQKIINNLEEEIPLTSFNNGNSNKSVLHLSQNPKQVFGYRGKSLKACIQPIADEDAHGDFEETLTEFELMPEEKTPDTLGYCLEKPNILRYHIGKGHFTISTAPLSMSNYFLLQPNNIHYLENLWSNFPENIGTIYWNDYYKRSPQQADLGVLLRYPATRWAIYLLLFSLVVFLLFESKRKQRIIPEIKTPENSSVAFAETIGRLYYNKGNHNNLAEKMVLQYLEWVRTHYFISTNKFDKHFADQLLFKSGLPETVVLSMIELLREVHVERKPVSEEDLFHLYQTIQQFYKTHSQ
jgi:hypothetical protein